MNVNIGLAVGALFKLNVHKGDGVPTKDTGWFHNLVLDTGLKYLSVGDAITHCYVGSGNSEPTINQTGLDVHLAGTNIVMRNIETGRELGAAKPYYWMRRTYRFNEGVAKGVLAEVGTGWALGSLFNRTLIKDDLGNPTTITILEDEFLDVVVEFRVYPQRSFTKQINLRNKLGTVVSTHTLTGGCIIGQDPSGNASLGRVQLGAPSMGLNGIIVYSDSAHLDDITTTCTGSQFEVSGNQDHPTPTSVRFKGRAELGSGNAFAHKAFQIGVSYLCTWQQEHAIGYKWEIDPPITKNINQVLQYTCTVSWGRHTEG